MLFRYILERGNINHNFKLGVFTVIGTMDNVHVVRIFPKESCTCSSTSRCYHRIAVRMSLGLESEDVAPKINLTQLRRKAKTRSDKRSGRKTPSVGDYTVNPAPDAQLVYVYMPMLYYVSKCYIF